jgi:hypothetical protein
MPFVTPNDEKAAEQLFNDWYMHAKSFAQSGEGDEEMIALTQAGM